MPETYAEIVNTLFGTDVTGVIAPVEDHTASLHVAEREVIQHASIKRQREFASGRYCARLALAQLGIQDFALLPGTQREPQWPDGIVGSISHTHTLAGAVVSSKTEYRGIGFDIETIKKLRCDIARHVCTEPERTWLEKQTPLPYHQAVILLFSIKEAVYKCIYQSFQIRIGFQECSVSPDISAGRAAVQIEPDKLPALPAALMASFQITPDYIFSGFVIPAA